MKDPSTPPSLSAVTRTATDALHAKAAAILHGGHRPVGVPRIETYVQLLQQMVEEPSSAAPAAAADASTATTGSVSTTATTKHPCPPKRPGRQTPLVHAGYLLRMQAILSALHRFVDYVDNTSNPNQTKEQPRGAQVILLGSGMDVTGLWASHFPTVQHVVEIDLPSVCQAKRSRLRQQGWVRFDEDVPAPSSSSSSSSLPSDQRKKPPSRTLFCGRMVHDPSKTFTLVGQNLRDDDDHDVDNQPWDIDRPTVIVSEVVLAYVGRTAVDRLLARWATAWSHNPRVCLVLLEPLGPSSSPSTTTTTTKGSSVDTPPSVLQAYQRQYVHHFRAKMARGTTTATTATIKDDPTKKQTSEDDLFAPLGTTPANVAHRLRQAGWPAVVTTSLAAATAQYSLPATTEPFDEFVALALYAQSYVVACAFPCVDASSSALFRRVMTPWTCGGVPPYHARKGGTATSTTSNGACVWIAPVDRTEEATVKKLFFDGYDSLSKSYKSVHKLMQSTLKKDIIFTHVDPQNEGIDFTSHFSEYYEQRGGSFVVAIDAATGHHQIAGFVAVDRASPQAVGLLAKHAVTFEIHRLFVVPEYRSQGVAGILLDAVERIGIAKCPSGTQSVAFVASTLNVLSSANRLYQRRGFVFEGEEPLGDVIVRHYVRQVANPRLDSA